MAVEGMDAPVYNIHSCWFPLHSR